MCVSSSMPRGYNLCYKPGMRRGVGEWDAGWGGVVLLGRRGGIRGWGGSLTERPSDGGAAAGQQRGRGR